jgi:DNA-binding HxlR family transcriptional regulator
VTTGNRSHRGKQPDGRAEDPLIEAVAQIGDRWSLLVVEALLPGPLRFNEILAQLPGIAPNILTQRLRRLERERVVAPRRYSERPPRLAYSLTDEGQELAGVLRLLATWGARGEGSEALRHLACGTALEAQWFCPTCARPVDDAEASTLRYA